MLELLGAQSILMQTSQIATKRSLLLSARLQFSPQTQPIRETAIEKIIEQTLFAATSQVGLTKPEILNMGNIYSKDPVPTLRVMDVDQALIRLEAKSRIEKAPQASKFAHLKYKLTDAAQDELQRTHDLIQTRFSGVVGRLFRSAHGSTTAYSAPFLDCLCSIFSKLADTYVRLIKGDLGSERLTGAPELLKAAQDACRKCADVDASLFMAGLVQFFTESDPEFDAIKWNMAQNYYVAKVLGIDETGYLLSEQVFGNSIFYLDTNVVIQALEPSARHHRSFDALSKACSDLAIELNVCKISLDELERVVSYHRNIIEKVHNQIPKATAPKVRGIFFQLYQERLESYGTVDFDELFDSFKDPLEILRKSYNVQLVDDKWFLEAEGGPDTSALAAKIRQEYFARRKKPKGVGSSVHDACMLRWIDFERQTSPRKAWLITLDTSLPYCSTRKSAEGERPLAITLAAFLQWISPITVPNQMTDEVASIFSEAMKYQLLPKESFFELRDFLMFAEMDLSCKELPSEDVEGCIRFIKATAPSLDPSLPSHREKLAHEIAKFMSDPGRKYKQELSTLENKISQVTTEAIEMNDEMKRKLQEQTDIVAKLLTEIDTLRKDADVGRLRRAAFARLAGVFSCWFLAEAATLYWTAVRPDPTHWLHKVMTLWKLYGLEFAVAILTSAILLGEKRVRSLGWPFTKILKIDDK